MNDSARLFLRMCAHWPQLGGDDELAEQRAHDWLTVMERYPVEVATEATETLIANWTGRWHPSIGDWRTLARGVATWSRRVPQLEAGDVKPDPERLAALLSEVSGKLRMERHKTQPRMTPQPERVQRPVDPNHRMPSYDDLYANTQEETP